MKLIVGLGNIGDEYKNTRHNLGFLVIDELVKRWDVKLKEEFSSFFATCFINGEKIIIVKPKLFMNNSGEVIKNIMDYFHIDILDLIIFVDDKDQDMANIKIVNRGGHGGQNGIKNSINYLKTNEFLRVKGGIGFNNFIETSDYVLGKWSFEQKKELPNFVNKLANIAEDFINLNFIELTNKYNGKN